MSLGPLQVLVINFDEANFSGAIEAELERLETAGILRTLDVLVVAKSESGEIEVLRSRGEIGQAILGQEQAAGDRELSPDEWAVADSIQAGGAAAIAVLEHAWAIPLREAIEGAGGHHVVAEWADPDDLAAMGISLTP